jgi:chromosome segregation ATPase
VPQFTIDVEARLAQFHDSLDRISKDASSTAAEINRAFSGLRATLAGLGVGISLAGFVSSIKSAIDLADELGKSSQKIGMTVEDLSALSYAAQLADVDMTTLQQSLKKLSVGMQETQAGTGEARVAFQALRISVEDASGSLKTNQQVLSEIADQFEQMEDGAGKTALAVKLFGRAGAELIPLLNAGSAGLKANAEEAKRFGIIISTEAAKAAEEFNDNLTRLGKATEALKISLAEGILPTLSTFVERILIARQAGDGLIDVMRLLTVNTGATGGNIVAEIAGVREQLDGLKKKRDELANPATARIRGLFGSDGLKAIDSEIATAEKKLKFLHDLGAKVLRDTSGFDEGAGTIAKRKAPALPSTNTPKLVDAKEVERAEQIMDKFRQKLRGMQDEIARMEGVDSALVALNRLLEVDKDLKELHREDKDALRAEAERVDLIKAEVAWQKEMNDARAAGLAAAEAVRNADTNAVNAIRDQLDPMRERNRELQRMLELVNAGRLSMQEFNTAAMDPRLRELLKPMKNDFTVLNEALKEGDISLEQYTDAVKRLRGEIEDTDSDAEELGFAFQSAFEEAVISGGKLSDVLKGLEKDIAKIILRRTITDPIGNSITDFVKGFDFSKLFGGARASGGPVSPGKAFLVGEEGPELFVPPSLGNIVPNGALGSGGVTIVQNMSFGSNVDRATLVQWGRQVKQETIAAVVDARKRNVIPA